MSSLNIHQQVFGLSLASNLLTTSKGTEAELQSDLDSKLQPTIAGQIGNWKVVWGPRVWKSEPDNADTPPDRVWYIAHNPSAKFGDETYDAYVLAIAGAAPESKENFEIATMVDNLVDFDNWVQLGINTAPQQASSVEQVKPYIWYGAAVGMSTLLTVPSPAGQTIIEFLSTIPSASRLVFTGHSLGGALSPIVALGLLRGGLLRNASANVLTYPTAGPSPGNGPFATLFAENFPLISDGPAAYQMWNGNLANIYDIVPYAWNVDSLKAIPTLYGTLPSELNNTVLALVERAIRQANASGLVYVPLQGQSFSATPPDTPQNLDELLQTITEEHITAYEKFIATSRILPLHELASSSMEGLPILGKLYTAHLEANGMAKLEREGA